MSDLDFLHRYIPPPTAKNSRVLLLLHGTGGDESDLLPLGHELDPVAALLSPRFFRRFAGGVFDEEDVVGRANELAEFIAEAAVYYGFKADRVTAVGYSNGVNIAAALMLLRPEALRSAILFRAMVTLSQPPAANLSGKRVLLCAGRHDPIIPPADVQRLGMVLKTAGAELTFQIHEAGHGLVQENLEAAKRWLA